MNIPDWPEEAAEEIANAPERIKAARMLRRVSTARKLGTALRLPRLGGDTMVSIESGRRPLYDFEADKIADRMHLPRSFFRADFHALGDVAAGEDAAATPITETEAEWFRQPGAPSDAPQEGTMRTPARTAGSRSERVLPPDPLAASGEGSKPAPRSRRATSGDAEAKPAKGRARSPRKRA